MVMATPLGDGGGQCCGGEEYARDGSYQERLNRYQSPSRSARTIALLSSHCPN
jgi:hypothetical protein